MINTLPLIKITSKVFSEHPSCISRHLLTNSSLISSSFTAQSGLLYRHTKGNAQGLFTEITL
ncbi:hypothetical protein SPRA44_600141 [Serratia proteamaculans]|nr:hypothetical protein SPRA44_600141 [Serratia proteamaculans]